MKRVVPAIGAAVGIALASPVFFTLYRAVSRPQPAELPSLIGSWSGKDEEGDEHTLRFNKFGMAAYEGPFGKHKGPLTLHGDGISTPEATPVVIEVEPALPLLFDTLHLRAELCHDPAGGSPAPTVTGISLRTAEATATLRKLR